MRKKIVITRAREYEKESVSVARSYGFDVIFVPMVATRSSYELALKDFFLRLTKGKVDFVVFTSANSVRYMFEGVSTYASTLGFKREDIEEKLVKALNNTNVVAIGPKTKRKLEEKEIIIKTVPSEYSSIGVAEALRCFVEYKRVEIVRSKKGNEELKDRLEASGAASVHEIKVYDIESPDIGSEVVNMIKMIKRGEMDAIAFTSSIGVRNFFNIAEKIGLGEGIKKEMKKKIVAAIGKPTAEELEKYGIEAIVPKNFTFESMLKEIKFSLERKC